MTAKAATGHLQIERPLLKEKTQSTSYIPPRRTPNPVEREHSDDHSSISEEQSLFIIRHGDRYDYENPEWTKTTSRPGDPPLSRLGQQQARETGLFLDSLLAQESIHANDVTWLSSPFLRCLETSTQALNAFSKINLAAKQILPEYSVFEWDSHNGQWHVSLPPLTERVHYFPRLNIQHQSVFMPELPEPKSAFLARCDRAMVALSKRHSYSPRSVLVIITHAAACIGLARAAANLTLQDISPAAPCSIYRLTRTSNSPVWHLDNAEAPNSMNGFVNHLSDLGRSTVPWNHFGDKRVNAGYSGPAPSSSK